MTDSKNFLVVTSLYLLDHLDTFIDGSSHRFLTKDMVSLFSESLNEWSVKLILSFSSIDHHAKSTYKDSYDDCIRDLALCFQLFPIRKLILWVNPSMSAPTHGEVADDQLMPSRNNLSSMWSRFSNCDYLCHLRVF